MIFARHFPTMRFTREQFDAMPIRERGSENLPPDGFSRRLDSAGKALVVWCPADWTFVAEDGTISGSYAVRPIIVAPSREPHNRGEVYA